MCRLTMRIPDDEMIDLGVKSISMCPILCKPHRQLIPLLLLDTDWPGPKSDILHTPIVP